MTLNPKKAKKQRITKQRTQDKRKALKMIETNAYMSILVTDIIRLNCPVNNKYCQTRYNPTMCHLHETQLQYKDREGLKVEGRKERNQTNTKPQSWSVHTTVRFRTKSITRHKENPYEIIRNLLPQEGITITNLDIPKKHRLKIYKVKIYLSIRNNSQICYHSGIF